MFDLTTMSCTATLAGHVEAVLGLAKPPTAPPAKASKANKDAGAAAASALAASASKDGGVRLWDALRGRCLALASGHIAAVSSVAFFNRHAPACPKGIR